MGCERAGRTDIYKAEKRVEQEETEVTEKRREKKFLCYLRFLLFHFFFLELFALCEDFERESCGTG